MANRQTVLRLLPEKTQRLLVTKVPNASRKKFMPQGEQPAVHVHTLGVQQQQNIAHITERGPCEKAIFFDDITPQPWVGHIAKTRKTPTRILETEIPYKTTFYTVLKSGKLAFGVKLHQLTCR